MRTYRLLPAVLVLLGCARPGYGMSMEQVGPPGVPPARVVEVPQHESRVYYLDAHNGDVHFYFKATPGHIGELIKLHSATRLRDHVVIISSQKTEDRTFHGDKVDYNVDFHCLDGIALSMI